MNIAYIGLGNMGAPMARNLVKAGHQVSVFDLAPDKVKALAAHGAHAAATGAQAVRGARVVFTSLPGPSQSAQAMPELIEAMSAGTIWIDLTTNDRELVLSLAEKAKAKDLRVLESPVTGAVDGARLGKLTLFVGGESATLAEAQSLFDILGATIHCGPIGTGNVVKLITNQIWFINAAAIGEGLVLGKKSGVELDVLWHAIKNSVGDTFVARHDVPSIFAGHYDPTFSLDLCCKDLGLIADLGEKTGTQMDLTQLAQEKFERARETFGGQSAELLVCKLIEDASGTDLRLAGDWQKHWEV
jgi:3-hydroxyisobutyrate dehydrogenase-like beta-hydroxyacid dehydrogenase